MAFVRLKKKEDGEYYYYVESYRVGEKVFSRNLKYLGKKKPTQEEVWGLEQEFTEKKIQKYIRSKRKFDSYVVSKDLLEKTDRIKEDFFNNLGSLSKEGKKQLISRFKTGYTYHSCSIEGNTLSRAEVDLVINKNQSIDGKRLYELQEVINHKKAIEYMMSEDEDLSELFIKKLHEVLMKNILEYKEEDPEFVIGGYRVDMRFIEGADFVPVPHMMVPFEMKDLIKFYKKNKYSIHPIELASDFHMKFIVIHPFSDGNGRIARLLMNFILDRSGFPMIDISVKNREEYIKALASGNDGELTKFICSELKNYCDEIFMNIRE